MKVCMRSRAAASGNSTHICIQTQSEPRNSSEVSTFSGFQQSVLPLLCSCSSGPQREGNVSIVRALETTAVEIVEPRPRKPVIQHADDAELVIVPA